MPPHIPSIELQKVREWWHESCAASNDVPMVRVRGLEPPHEVEEKRHYVHKLRDSPLYKFRQFVESTECSTWLQSEHARIAKEAGKKRAGVRKPTISFGFKP